jgi:hypothetical protein
MSSMLRRIERQAVPSRKIHVHVTPDGERIVYAKDPREVFYGGRGKALGVKNPEDKALLARRARETRNIARRKAAPDA